MSCGSSRHSSCGSESGWKSCSSVDLSADPISPPQLLCACKIPLGKKTSHTARNPDREYFQCQKGGNNGNFSCKTWIWVDLVTDYVNQMVNFRLKDALEKMGQELGAVRKELAEKMNTLCGIERDSSQQRRAHQEETSVLKLQIETLESQINTLNSSAKKFKMLRFIFLCVAMFLFVALGVTPSALVVASIVALMYLV